MIESAVPDSPRFLERLSIAIRVAESERQRGTEEPEELPGQSRGKRDIFIPSDARKPIASANKGRIMIWMTYWPTSMLWTIVNDPVKRIFKEIFRRVRAVYDAISDHMYKGTDE